MIPADILAYAGLSFSVLAIILFAIGDPRDRTAWASITAAALLTALSFAARWGMIA